MKNIIKKYYKKNIIKKYYEKFTKNLQNNNLN